MFCADSRRWPRADEHGAVDLAGCVERPLQHLHAAERAADRARAAARSPRCASSRRWTVTRSRDREQREVAGRRRVPVAGSIDDRPGGAAAAAEQVRADHEEAVGVDAARPGPIMVSHQPGRVGVAVVAGGVRVAGQRVADEDRVRARRRRARRRSRRRPRPGRASRRESSTSGSSCVNRTTRCGLDRCSSRAHGRGRVVTTAQRRPRAAASAWSRSAMMSSMCSMPTESRTMSSVHAGRRELLVGQLGVRGGGVVDRQRLGVADVGQVAEQLQALDELLAGLAPALDPEGDEAAVAAGEDRGRRPPCTGSSRGPG